MEQLTTAVKIQIVLFVAFAFSAYYGLYFQSFSQGVVEEGNIDIYLIKAFSLILFIGAFYSPKIKFNYFDFQYLTFTIAVSISYIFAAIYLEFNDVLFLNFLIFSFCYPLLTYENADKKIYYAYEVLCGVIFFQAIGDMFISAFGLTLWEGGLFIGGLGNPTSFAFVTLFCFTYLIFANTSFSNNRKIFFGIMYVISIIMTKAFFPILLMFAVLLISIFVIKSIKKKFSLTISFLLTIAIFYIFLNGEGGLLANKYKSLLHFLGLSDELAESVSVSLRAENMSMGIDFLNNVNFQSVFGHYQGLTYYPVDSQFISILLSFGVLVFLYFIAFNLTALLRIYNTIRSFNGLFIFIGFILCNLMFINNRILDYFPLGFIYISLIGLISVRKKKYSEELNS